MKTAKEILLSIKAMFDAPAPPAQPAANPADTTGATSCSYNVDGGGAVFVDISDDGVPDIDANDKVFSDPALTVPYPDGTYNVTGTQFGFTVAGGIVTAVTDVAGTGPGAPVSDPNAMAAPKTAVVPAAPTIDQRVAAIEATLGKLTNPGAPAQMSDHKPLTLEAAQTMFAKFGAGNANDRLDNLEIMIKALMECNFGYQIQQGLQADAILAYQQSVATQVTELVASTQKFESAITTIAEQKAKIEKQDTIIKGFFELAEQMVDAPKADPKTVNGEKKEKFERVEKKEKHFEKILAGLKVASTDKKY